jgi:hypothetical protein
MIADLEPGIAERYVHGLRCRCDDLRLGEGDTETAQKGAAHGPLALGSVGVTEELDRTLSMCQHLRHVLPPGLLPHGLLTRGVEGI